MHKFFVKLRISEQDSQASILSCSVKFLSLKNKQIFCEILVKNFVPW